MTATDVSGPEDIDFYFDPVCPARLDDRHMGPTRPDSNALHRRPAVHLPAPAARRRPRPGCRELADALDDEPYDAELRREWTRPSRSRVRMWGLRSSSSTQPKELRSSAPRSAACPPRIKPDRYGTTSSGWPRLPASPNSNATCANGQNCAGSASTPSRSVRHRDVLPTLSERIRPPGSHAMLALHEFVGVEHQAITDLSCVDQA